MKRSIINVLSVVLALIMLVMSLSVGLVAVAQIAVTGDSDVYAIVPETIYLTPSKDETSTAQYFINNTFNKSSLSTALDASANDTTGKFYFYCADAVSVNVKVSAGASSATASITGSSTASGANIVSGYTMNASSGYVYGTVNALTLSAGLSYTGTSVITWTFTYTFADGTSNSVTAYTVAYAPFVTPVVASLRTYYTAAGYKINMEGVSWISGVHDVNENYPWGIGGGIDIESNRYASSTTNCISPLLGDIVASSTGPQQVGVKNYSSTDAPYYDGQKKTVVYGNRDAGANDKIEASVYSYIGEMTVDTSRNSNLSTVPNMNVGFMVTYLHDGSNDRDSVNDSKYYISDYSAITDDGWNKNDGANDNTRYENYVGTLFPGQNKDADRGSTPGLVYDGTWDRAVGTGVNRYSIKSALYGHIKHSILWINHNAYSILSLQTYVDVTGINKSALRSKIADCQKSGFQEDQLTSGSWSTYVTALRTAYTCLGNPTATQAAVDNACTSLESAKNSLVKTSATATALHYGIARVLDGTGATTGYKVTPVYTSANLSTTQAAETMGFNASDKVTLSANAYSGYTYQGYMYTSSDVDIGASATSMSYSSTNSSKVFSCIDNSDISAGHQNITFYYKANDCILTINPNGGTMSNLSSVTGSFSSMFTLSDPTRAGCTFAGWTLSGGGSLNGKVYTFGTSNATLTAQWTPTNSLLTPDVKVMDFCLATKFSGFTSNDTILNEYIKDGGYTVTVVGLGSAVSNSLNALDSSYKNSRIASNGIFELTSDGCIVYSPDKAMPVSNQRDSIYYALKVSNSSETFYLYTKLTVIPGTSIYYEDSMPEYITYTNGTVAAGADATGVWKTTGVPQSISSALDSAADVVGQSVYASSTTFSLGSAHEVTVSANNNKTKGGSWPHATFTFVGTGFDLISVMSYNSGAAEVQVFKDTDPIDDPSYDWVVDTYYEYSYTGEKWQPSDGTNSLYQIPVIGRTDLEYGTYTVKVIPTYSSRLDHQKNGSYEFYIDAVRVYNPLKNDSEANNAYAATGDYIISNEAIRDMLISSSQLSEAPITGSVFINVSSADASVADYKNTGAKNEVYLKKDQGISFSVSASQKPSKVQISAHAISAGAELRFGNGNGSYSAAVPITSGTTLFYTIPSNLLSWTYVDGQYVSSEIVIQSTGIGVISLCNLKCSSDTVPPQAAPASIMFMMSSPFATRAAVTAFTMANLPSEANALFVPENVETQEITETVVSGSDVEITTTTSADVERLTIDGKDATCTGVNEDGTKTWICIYTTAKSSGTEKLEIVAYDSMGVASESTETSITTETKFEMFFDNLLKIFKMLFEFVNNVVNIAQS